MKENQRKRIARKLGADQVGESHRHALRRCKAILAIEDHRVGAIEHHDSGARALVLALVHAQIGVLQIERQPDSLAGNRLAQGRRGVEVEGVAKFVRLGGAAGLDSGGPMPRVMAAVIRFAEGTQKIAQGFESEKIEALVGHFEANRAGGCASAARSRL